MAILLTNDDGIEAEGLQILLQGLADLDDITIVAPLQNNSGVGHAITLGKPLQIHSLPPIGNVARWAVDGTPADAVKFALKEVFREKPPMLVVSGINPGLNIGVNVLYSGTVGAAFEAVIGGISSVAVSIETDRTHTSGHWDSAIHFARQALHIAIDLEISRREGKIAQQPFCLNLNVPAKPVSEISGLRFTRHGCSGFDEEFNRKESDPENQYWLDGEMKVKDPDEFYDSAALKAGYATLTPLQPDFTNHNLLHYMNNNGFKHEDQ